MCDLSFIYNPSSFYDRQVEMEAKIKQISTKLEQQTHLLKEKDVAIQV
jgi:hypothetical protein